MLKLKLFLRRYLLWVGLLAVIVPLLIILGLQYWSLVKLEETLPVAGKAGLTNYLTAVSSEIQDFYQNNTHEVLGVPAREFSEKRLSTLALHFKRKPVPEAKSLFIVSFIEPHTGVLFYNPERERMEAFPESPETRAVNVASAPWRLLSEEETTMQSEKVFGVLIDQEHRILMNPIVDESSKLVGVAGMIVDTVFFKDK